MITLTREEAQQVLDALETVNSSQTKMIPRDGVWTPIENVAIETLRSRLAQPEPEPVAWTVGGLITDFSRDFSAYKTKAYTRPLYTAPPQREWQGLTDDEITRLRHLYDPTAHWSLVAFAHAIEAKLKEKNI